jgi:hypothetical protein
VGEVFLAAKQRVGTYRQWLWLLWKQRLCGYAGGATLAYWCAVYLDILNTSQQAQEHHFM